MDTISLNKTKMVKKPDGSLTENPSETLDVMTEVNFATQVGGDYPPTDTQMTRADDNRIPVGPRSHQSCFRKVGIASRRHWLVSLRQASFSNLEKMIFTTQNPTGPLHWLRSH